MGIYDTETSELHTSPYPYNHFVSLLLAVCNHYIDNEAEFKGSRNPHKKTLFLRWVQRILCEEALKNGRLHANILVLQVCPRVFDRLVVVHDHIADKREREHPAGSGPCIKVFTQ